MPSWSLSAGWAKPGVPPATTFAFPEPLLPSSRACDDPVSAERDGSPAEALGVLLVPSTPPAVVMSTEPGAATGPTTPIDALALLRFCSPREAVVCTGRLSTVSAGPSLEELSESGQSFQPTRGAAIAPTPSTPAHRPAATVPAKRRSRTTGRVVRAGREELLWSVMSESPCLRG